MCAHITKKTLEKEPRKKANRNSIADSFVLKERSLHPTNDKTLGKKGGKQHADSFVLKTTTRHWLCNRLEMPHYKK